MTNEIATKLAQFAVETHYDQIPVDAISYAKGLLLKTVAGIISGSVKPASLKMTKIIRERNLPGDVGVVGCSLRTGLWESVLLNAYFAHASELEDDRTTEGLSWDITVIPVLLSLAEGTTLSGKALLEALIIGLEVHVRTCLFYTGHIELGIVPGAVGPAVAAARVFGLGAEQTASAMGLAMSGVPVSPLNVGTDAHFLESALQSLHGLVSAVMAREGMSSNPNLGRYLVRLLGKDRVDPNKMVANLGQDWRIREICVKKYPCCVLTQRQIDSTIELMRERHLSYEQIDTIEVYGNKDDRICDRPDPKTEGDLQFSYQHLLAAVMLDGDVDMTHMTEQAVAEPRLAEARKKVKVFTRADLPTGFLAVPSRVVIKTRDGKEYSRERKYILGSLQEPLTNDQFRALYFKYTRGLLPDQAMNETADMLMHLEELDDVRGLINSLTFQRKAGVRA